MYTAAVIVAAVQFAHVPADEKSEYNNYRYLAGEGYETSGSRWTLTDLPLTLTALAYLLNIFHTTWRKMRATSGKHGDIRTRFVPNNISYMIHRYGEWIMLMIGDLADSPAGRRGTSCHQLAYSVDVIEKVENPNSPI